MKYTFIIIIIIIIKGFVSGLREFFRQKNQQFFRHMIHQIYVEFPQDHEYAIQKILRPIVF